MSLLCILETAFANLRAHKLRTALTMLGIVIGVGAVIVMVSLMEGARTQMVREFDRLGSRLILVLYDPDLALPKGHPRQAAHPLDGMTMDDVRAIRSQCSLVGAVCAEVPVAGEMTVSHLGREAKARPSGVEPEYESLRAATVARGRFVTHRDEARCARVCVIGARLVRELFPHEDPLGKDIRIAGVEATVVGVLSPRGRTGQSDDDSIALLPLATAQKRCLGRDLVGMVSARPRDPEQMAATMDQLWACLMRRHDNAPGFQVDSQENMLKASGRILTSYGLVLGGIAGLALLVGGIGIANVMLMTVGERTREIGIRKAIGAKASDILFQFLAEAASVAGAGGGLGILLGAGAAWAASALVGRAIAGALGGGALWAGALPVCLPAWAVLGAFLFSVLLGVAAGIFPALRAARLCPIQALRHE